MKSLLLFLILLPLLSACQAQATASTPLARLVGAPCQGCEAVLEAKQRQIKAIDTLPLFHTSSKPLKISGTVYQPDGKTPAVDVVLYLYHTNEKGLYPSEGDEGDWSRKHGHLRTWLKTDQSGHYTLYTGQPASYPNREIPAHIHLIILEPNGKYYYVEDYYFANDPYLTKEELNPQSPRGGTKGVVNLQQDGNLWIGQRNLILGKNIPNYN